MEDGQSMSSGDHSLGAPIRVFRANLTTCLVVAACGIISLCGGGWLSVEMGPTGPGHYVITLGLFTLALAYFLGKSSYTVCADGIIVERLGWRRNCRWSDVVGIVDRHTKQGMASSRSCVLRGKAGQMELQELGYDFDGMMVMIRKEAQRRQIPLREEQVDGKETIRWRNYSGDPGLARWPPGIYAGATTVRPIHDTAFAIASALTEKMEYKLVDAERQGFHGCVTRQRKPGISHHRLISQAPSKSEMSVRGLDRHRRGVSGRTGDGKRRRAARLR